MCNDENITIKKDYCHNLNKIIAMNISTVELEKLIVEAISRHSCNTS